MKIAIIGPVFPYRGGIAHYTASLAGSFQKLGHEVRVFSYRRQYPKWLYPGKSDKDPSQQPIQFSAEYLLDTMFPYTWIKSAQSITKYQPDIVLINWWTTFMAPVFFVIAIWMKIKKLPVYYLVHNLYPHEKRWFDRALTRLALSLGDVYIVQSQQEEQKILNLFPKSKVYFHPHPIYDFIHDAKISKREAKIRLGLNPELPVALFFGIVRPYKGLYSLIECIPYMNKEGVKIQLLIAGEFWEDIQLYERKIEQLGIKDQVIVHNQYIPNEEISMYFCASDVFVAPYREGTQSGTVKLAMSFGIPIIVSEVVADDIVKSYLYARIFSLEIPNQLPKLIISTLTERYNECKKRNNNDYNWESLVRKIEKIYISMSK